MANRREIRKTIQPKSKNVHCGKPNIASCVERRHSEKTREIIIFLREFKSLNRT